MTKLSGMDNCPMDISEKDVLEAMKSISGYLDITPADFREIYQIAYRHSFDRLNKSIKAEEVMTREVIHAYKENLLDDIAKLLTNHNISGLPVLDSNDRVVGVISEKDFIYEISGQKSRLLMEMVLTLIEDKDCLFNTLKYKKAEDIMSYPPICIRKEDSVFDIAHIFEEKNINRVPVVDKDMKLIGIVTRSDIVQSFCLIPESET